MAAGPVATGLQAPRRRSLDTVVIAEGAPAEASGGVLLAKVTRLATQLAAPAVTTADLLVDGTLVVPKGTVVVCVTVPSSGRVGMACDTLQVRGRSVAIDAIALGPDGRVVLPLAGQSTPSTGVGDAAREPAMAVG